MLRLIDAVESTVITDTIAEDLLTLVASEKLSIRRNGVVCEFLQALFDPSFQLGIQFIDNALRTLGVLNDVDATSASVFFLT